MYVCVCVCVLVQELFTKVLRMRLPQRLSMG